MTRLVTLLRLAAFYSLTAGSAFPQGNAPPLPTSEISLDKTEVVNDVEKLVIDAEALIVDVADNDKKTQSSDLKKVRDVRSRLVRRAPELRTLLDLARQARSLTQAQLQEKQASSPPSDVEELLANANLSKDNATLVLEQEEQKEASFRTMLQGVAEESDKLGIMVEINSAKQTALSARYEIARAQREIDRLSRIQSGPNDIGELQKKLEDMDRAIERAQSVSRRSDDAIEGLDELSGSLLQTNLLSSQYTDRSTWIFGALVGLVIVGFFVIAFRSAKIQEAIFAGDSGIQFVTLFSLVIAIILFGILGILEDKELSALLGGLSGYILGRNTSGGQVASSVPAGSGVGEKAPKTE